MQAEHTPIRLTTRGKLITIAIIIALCVLLLRAIGHVLVPFVASIITAYLFNPLIGWLQQRTHIRRSIWIIVLYLLAFSLLSGLGIWVWPRIVVQYEDLQSRLPLFIDSIAQTLDEHHTVAITPAISINLRPLEDQLIGTISDLGRSLSGNVPHLFFSAAEVLLYTLVYLIVTFYLLLHSQQLKVWTVQLIPLPYRHEVCGLGSQIDRVLSAYIRGQLLLVVIMSVLTYIPLAILRVPYALVIAVASGILELIPLIGPWSAAGIAMSVALFQPDVPFDLSNVALAGLIGLIYFVLRQIEDSFIIPNVVGHLVRLHPALVIFAILAGGSIAGPLGLFIAIPTAAVMRILLSYLYQKLVDDEPAPDEPGTPDAPGELASAATIANAPGAPDTPAASQAAHWKA